MMDVSRYQTHTHTLIPDDYVILAFSKRFLHWWPNSMRVVMHTENNVKLMFPMQFYDLCSACQIISKMLWLKMQIALSFQAIKARKTICHVLEIFMHITWIEHDLCQFVLSLREFYLSRFIFRWSGLMVATPQTTTPTEPTIYRHVAFSWIQRREAEKVQLFGSF